MNEISNDTEFRDALDSLSPAEQRALAVRLVENVLSLSTDKRLSEVLKSAADTEASPAALAAAFKEAKVASLEAHARCGAEGDWNDQAGYFVARAAQACIETQVQSGGKNPAWKAAMNCRMARTCLASESEEDSHNSESQAQYEILGNYLNS